MPITRDQFDTKDEHFREATRRIREFLSKNSESAFTEAEIRERVAPEIRDAEVRVYLQGDNGSPRAGFVAIESSALHGLVLSGAVRAKL